MSLFLACVPPEPIEIEKSQQPRRAPVFRGHKRIIGVLNFENQFGVPGAKIGEAVSDKLITQLLRTNRFILIERSQIEKILEEQSLAQAGLVSEETRVAAGQLLGVQALVQGAVVEFEESFESGKIGQKKEKWEFRLNASIARVAIKYKLVDVVSGRILLSDQVFEQKIKPSFGLKTKKYDLNNLSELDQTLVGKALKKAVDEIAVKISRRARRITWYGKVLKVTDDFVYFTPGREAGIEMDEVFEIQSREAAEAGSENIFAGLIQVVGFLQDKVAKARLIEGGEIYTGDWVVEYEGAVPTPEENF